MKFTTRAKVLGMKMFKDQVEGKPYDTTKVYIETDLDSSTGMAVGYASQEMPFGTSDEYHKYKHMTFPFMADVSIELVTTGKLQKQRVEALVPVQAVPNKPEK